MMSEDWECYFSEPFDPPNVQTVLGPEKFNDRHESYSFTCFDCLGEVNSNKIDIQTNGYFKSDNLCYLSSRGPNKSNYGSISLFNKSWDRGMAYFKDFDLLFKMMSKEIMLLEQGASVGVPLFSNNITRKSSSHESYRDSRYHCIKVLLYLKQTIEAVCSDTKYLWFLKDLSVLLKRKLKALRKHLGHIIDLPDFVFSHAANSSGNKSTQASYHLLHLHLDIRWLYILCLQKLSHAKSILNSYHDDISISSDELFGEDDIINEINVVIVELLELSHKRFEKTDVIHLRNKSPFSCTCVQELWMLLIRVTTKLSSENKGKPFWELLNSYLDLNLHQTQEMSETLKFYQPSSTNFSIFSLWTLCNVGRLHNYVLKDYCDNYALLQSNLKILLAGDVSEASLRIIMMFIEKLCLEVWEPRPETILILWDHFHKKLNSNFYVPGAPPSTLAIVCKTPKSLINQLKSYIDDSSCIHDSFQHFLRILGIHLKKSHSVPRNWNLLKGRLYSKLTLPKLESLSNVGEYHFVSLYLILAIAQDLTQIEAKMVELIKSYVNKKNYLSEELVKGQLGMVLLLLEDKKDISNALQPITDYILTLSILENLDIFRLYIETFQDILNMDVPLSFGQHLLIGKWISEYLSCSAATDVSRMLDTIVSLLNRLKMYCDFDTPEQNVIMMIEKLWDQVKSYLESISSQQETPYQVSEIAASLAYISLQIRNKERFSEIVNMFALRNVTDISALRHFVFSVSQNEGIGKIMPGFDKVVLKTWIKCCFLCSDLEHMEIKELTRTVIRLPEMKNLLGDSVLSFDLDCSTEPFLNFITCLHHKYTAEDIWKKQALRDQVSVYFEGLEKWIHPIVANPRDHGKILALYKTVGNMIRLISPLIYSKSKPNTILQKMIDLLLLPISVRNPETKIHPHILAAVKASLHLFIEGLIYLDPESDHYISRVLKELILVYIPHCMTANNQYFPSSFLLISSFVNYDNASRGLIIDLLINIFLKKKANNPHRFAHLALKFIREIIVNNKTNEDVMVCIINKALHRICDIVMFSEEKSNVSLAGKEMLTLVLNSEILRSSAKGMDGVMNVLSILSTENLAWSSRQLFDLLVFMTSVAPDIVRRFTPKLLEQVKHVETKRGVGYDRTLRLGIERIESCLRAIKDVT